MFQMTNSAHSTDRMPARNVEARRFIGRVFVCIRYSAIPVMSAFALSGHAFAAHGLGLQTISGYPIIQVGQQQSGYPIMLHGVFEGFDARAHRLKLAHLDEIDFSWADTMRNVEVDNSVTVAAIEPGTAVTATLKRRSDGTYYVSKLTGG